MHMNVGVIGYGSMGKILGNKFALKGEDVYVSTRTPDKLKVDEFKENSGKET